MPLTQLAPPYPIFTDKNGDPLDAGYLYFGEPNQNPETNPIQVYWDAALTQPAAQPIRTANGYPSRNGTPALIYANSQFSVTVRNKQNELVIYSPVGLNIVPGTAATLTDQMTYNEGSVGAVNRVLTSRLQDYVSVKDFGAIGDGVTDDTAAIQAALGSGAKRIFAPAGTYVLTATLVIPDNVSLDGDGVGATIFDGSGATYANLTSGRHITTAGGTWGALPSLSADVSKGARTLTFASAPSVVPGDVIQIYNPTDFSFSNFRAEYRAGEFIRVAKVSGTTVTLQGTLCDSYLAADVDLYKLEGATSCHLRGFTLKGLGGSSGAVFGINLFHAVDSSIEDVRVYGCSYTQIGVNQSFNTQMRGCTCEEDFTTNFAGDYGLAISNSHIVNVTGGYFSAARHGVTTGGFSGVGCVSCRYMSFQGATISCSGDAQAADFHGNMEYAWFDNCVLDGGFVGGGDYMFITNNVVRGNTPGNGNILIYVAEMRGANFKIANNICSMTTVPTTGFGGFIHCSFSVQTPKGGVADISGNKFIWDVAAGDVGKQTLLVQSSYEGTEPIDVFIHNNTISSSTNARFGVLQVRSVTATAVPYRTVSICDNVITDSGAILVQAVVAGQSAASKVIVSENTIENVRGVAILVRDVTDYIECRNNHITNCEAYPINLQGISGGAACYHIDVSDNTLLNNLTLRTSSATTNVGLLVQNVTYATVRNNVTGSFNEFIQVASNAGFVVGETITGGTSGATATITGFRSATEIMLSRTRVGSFTVAETITGGTSSATTTVSVAELYCQGARLRLDAIGNLCAFNNNDLRLNNDSLGTISGYLSGCVLTGVSNLNPAPLSDGAGVTVTMTVTGAELSDQVSVSYSLDLEGVTLTAWVSAPNTVGVRFQNETGGTVDLGTGTLYARVVKR